MGQSITILIPPERLSEEDTVLARIRSGQRVDHFDTRRRRKDGTVVDVSITVSPIRDATGAIVGASKIARDISERIRIGAELQTLQHRLMAFAVASASILGSPNVETVLSATLDLARDVFSSDGYGLWRVDAAGVWRMARSFGISDEFAARILSGGAGRAEIPRVPFAEPLICEDVATAPMLADMREAYIREGIASMIVFPLLIRGERSATMVFYSRQPARIPRHGRSRRHRPGESCGRVTDHRRAVQRTTAGPRSRRPRAAAGHISCRGRHGPQCLARLPGDLDGRRTVGGPAIADWCAVDIMGERGALHRLAVAHVDPEKVELARTLQERYPADPNASGGVHEVIRTGRPAFMSRIPAALIAAARGGRRRTSTHHRRTAPDLVHVCAVIGAGNGLRRHHVRQR